MKILFLTAIIILISIATLAKRLHKEKLYQQICCNQGQGEVEYRLPDKTRVDCLSTTHAVEHDFGSKWADAIGQGPLNIGKRSGIVLIIDKEKRWRYLIRLNATIKFTPRLFGSF
jgi:hypothetical protein